MPAHILIHGRKAQLQLTLARPVMISLSSNVEGCLFIEDIALLRYLYVGYMEYLGLLKTISDRFCYRLILKIEVSTYKINIRLLSLVLDIF